MINSTFPPQRRGFTLIELIVVISILITLAGISYPIYMSMAGKADRQACAANMKELYTWGMAYAEDHRSVLPCSGMDDDPETPWDESMGWWMALTPYVLSIADRPEDAEELPKLPHQFRCPSDPRMAKYNSRAYVEATPENISYASWTDNSEDPSRTGSGIQMTRGRNLTATPWLSDGYADSITSICTEADYDEFVVPRLQDHGNGIIVLYADGAIKQLDEPTFKRIAPLLQTEE